MSLSEHWIGLTCMGLLAAAAAAVVAGLAVAQANPPLAIALGVFARVLVASCAEVRELAGFGGAVSWVEDAPPEHQP